MVFSRCGRGEEPEPGMLEGETAIEVRHLTKRFRIPLQRNFTMYDRLSSFVHRKKAFYEEFDALKDVNIRLMHGDAVGIIGPNGSGKSTLLKLIAGVLYPDKGCVMVRGQVAPFLELGVGFEPELSARENIYLYGAIMGIPRKEIDRKYWDILNFAELRRFEFLKLRNFSSGMYARLAFSIAIQSNPDIMLLDEVLAVGDEQFQKKCMSKIEEFRHAGKTIVLVSHDLSSIEKICNQGILLQNGQVEATGSPEHVIEAYHRIMERG
ncbi:MAG: ABC transporter ATP-binding protein [Methanoregulaceae archaeon]|jgi:lipopolysaccharide transport system ATP-binding protein|nr:ABC transporter ATP-binding protein [Methanoregulaceae archaeon]